MPCITDHQPKTLYQIEIKGNLDDGWSSWFNRFELSYQEQKESTILIGQITDQAELRGIVNKLWDLNKSIISVCQLPDRILK